MPKKPAAKKTVPKGNKKATPKEPPSVVAPTARDEDPIADPPSVTAPVAAAAGDVDTSPVASIEEIGGASWPFFDEN